MKPKPKSKKSIEQYDHKDKQRLNNPPVGLVDSETDKDTDKKQYQYDPHLDPQLEWAGKAERTSFEVPTVSLHVHERIDPRTIIEAVRKRNGDNGDQMSLFSSPEENPPLRDAIEFYKHRHNWTNRLIAGDSLVVMNSLIEKEGMAGKVQMIYIDPPYGIKYGSNFQPFVNKRDVRDGKDEDLTAEPEMIKAFRDTWELGIHSYLTYMRDRLLLVRELLHDSGSVFVQISDENVHHVREVMDEVFGSENFISIITFLKRSPQPEKYISTVCDYLLWYGKNKPLTKYRNLFNEKENSKKDEFTTSDLTSSHEYIRTPFKFKGRTFDPGARYWSTSIEGLQNLAKADRLVISGNTLRFKRYHSDFPLQSISNVWTDVIFSSFAEQKLYAVQTAYKVLQRCILMTTDPGDLVLDPTCGSGTTAYVAEQWGRRWITCDTSRVAITLAKQRFMTSTYDYYELAHPDEGVGSGFKYKTVPHITLKSIANNEPPAQETLYDQPNIDKSKVRVTGPLTLEAVPAPTVKSIDEVRPSERKEKEFEADHSIARRGETLRQSEWREELLKSGIRGKNGQYILFSRVEPLQGTRWLHAEAETKPNERGADTVKEKSGKYRGSGEDEVKRVVISFGPEHAPLEARQVSLALEEARNLRPKPEIIVFAAFQFDSEAAKDIEETNWPGITLLKVQMNADLLTDDLKKKRSSNDSFWLIGQPDINVTKIKSGDDKGKFQVEVLGFDYYNTKTGTIESGSQEKIAMWMLDTDYDGRSLFPRQVFFPMAGEKEGWSKLARNLKAEIDEEKIEAYRGTVSLPFEPGEYNRIAVKIIDDRGIESLKVVEVG